MILMRAFRNTRSDFHMEKTVIVVTIVLPSYLRNGSLNCTTDISQFLRFFDKLQEVLQKLS